MLFVDSFIDVLLIPNPRAISAPFTRRLVESQCVVGAKKKPEKIRVNAGGPITVTTAIVLLIQSVGGEDAPKTGGEEGEIKTPAVPPALLCSSLSEQNVLECSLPLFTGPAEWSSFF